MSTARSPRIKVFISYSHKDNKWLERVRVHLKPLEREGNLECWDDTMIHPGEEWRRKIREAIDLAKAAVLLVTADFMASDFIVKNELPPLLDKAEKEGMKILPVIISPSSFEETPKLVKFEAINSLDQPLKELTEVEQEKVFNRMAAIIRNISIPEPPPCPEHNFVSSFPPRPPLCVGRERELREIRKRLKSPGCVYICGAPGVGKTTLASEVVWRLRDHFRDQIIYDLALNHTFEDILNLIARSFSENLIAGFALEDKQRAVDYLLCQHRPTLIYLDHVKGPRWAAQFEKLVGSCSLLITSRVCARFNWIDDRKLKMLDRDFSIELFEKVYQQPLSKQDRKYVGQICQLLGDMPFAIDICARHAKFYRLPLNRFPGMLRTEMSVFLKPVDASINLSYEDLDDKAKRFFVMLSLFGVRAFGIEAVKAIWDNEDDFEQLLQLNDLMLVQPIGDGRYVMHPVIQHFAANKLYEFKKDSFFLDRMINYFLEFAENNRTDFKQLEVERENIFAAMRECGHGHEKINSYLRFAEALLEMYPDQYAYGFLSQKGFWQEAMEIVKRCLELTADNPKLQAKWYEHLGLFHYWKGEHEKAMQAYEKALALCRQYNNYYGEAMILQRQGFIQSDEGFYRECERLYRKSVEIARQYHLADEILATGIHLVGVILYHQCRYEESRKELEEALDMRQQISRMRQEMSNVGVSVTQRRLAATYRRIGLLSKAEKLLLDCLKVEEEGGNERNIARCLRQLGMLQQIQGFLNEAHSSFEQSHEIFRRIGNKKGIASVLTNLGDLSIKQGHIKDAKSHLEKSLEIAKGLHSLYGMAMNKRWLAEISYQNSEYRLTVEQAIEALSNFESIGYIHVEDICQLLNKALFRLSLDEARQLSLPDPFEGQCSTAIKTNFKELWDEARSQLNANDPSIDEHLLDLGHDERRGYSLIIRLSEEIKQLLSRVRDHLRAVAPNHHYYDSSEFHVTVMTLINATEPMYLDENLVSRYKEALSEILSHHRPFRIHFRGISASKDSVMVIGFFKDDSLDQIRRAIQEQAVALGFPGKIEERYPSISAHVTFVRFRSQENVKELVQEIDRLESCELGVCPVDELKLVMNDWYMSKDKVNTLASFKLK